MKRKDLENIILQAYTEILLENKGSFDYEQDFEEDKIIFWKDIPDNIKKGFKKNIKFRGRPAPGDPERDYVDKNYETYYYTVAYNDETKSYKHHLIRLPSFENLYNRYSKILSDIKVLMGRDAVKADQAAKDVFELMKTNFRKLQSYLRKNHPEQYERFKMRRIMEEDIKAGTKLNGTLGSYFRLLNENLLDQVNEQEPEPEEAPDTDAPKDTVLEDSTDKILTKFPTLKNAIIKLQTEDFKEFVESIDWVSPRPTSFRVNLKNGQDYILKWMGEGFQAQIMGKRYYLNKIDDYQQALDKLEVLYRQAPLQNQGGEEGEGADDDFGSADTGGGDFPGADAGTGAGSDLDTPDAGGGEEGGADLTDEPIDFEAGEEPEA